MYARIVRAHYDPAREAAALGVGQDRLLPAYRGMPGFQGCTISVDRDAQRTATITFWETEEQARDVIGALGAVAPQLQAAGVDSAEAPEIYEVVLQS